MVQNKSFGDDMIEGAGEVFTDFLDGAFRGLNELFDLSTPTSRGVSGMPDARDSRDNRDDHGRCRCP